MPDSSGEFISNETISRVKMIINSLSTGEEGTVDFTYDEISFNALNAKVNVDRVGLSKGKHVFAYNSLTHK